MSVLRKLWRRKAEQTPREPMPVLRQDPAADEHHLYLQAAVGDTEDWIHRHGGTWGPADDRNVSAGIRISQDGAPDIDAAWGDTLFWDGQQITVRR